jgi:hypothetical protein
MKAKHGVLKGIQSDESVIPSIILLQNGIFCAEIKWPLLLVSSVHGSLSKSTDGLHSRVKNKRQLTYLHFGSLE